MPYKADKAAVAEQYFGLSGLEKLELDVDGTGCGKAKMSHSHVDEGWTKKWKKEDREVNYIQNMLTDNPQMFALFVVNQYFYRKE